MSDFIVPLKTIIGQDDGISCLYKEGKYFIINTLNGRVFIFKLEKGSLKSVKIPEKLYKDIAPGFHFIKYLNGDAKFAYFENNFDHDNVILVFDYKTERFKSLELPSDKESIYDFIRNSGGDLIVKKRQKNYNQFEYFYLKSPLK